MIDFESNRWRYFKRTIEGSENKNKKKIKIRKKQKKNKIELELEIKTENIKNMIHL